MPILILFFTTMQRFNSLETYHFAYKITYVCPGLPFPFCLDISKQRLDCHTFVLHTVHFSWENLDIFHYPWSCLWRWIGNSLAQLFVLSKVNWVATPRLLNQGHLIWSIPYATISGKNPGTTLTLMNILPNTLIIPEEPKISSNCHWHAHLLSTILVIHSRHHALLPLTISISTTSSY